VDSGDLWNCLSAGRGFLSPHTFKRKNWPDVYLPPGVALITGNREWIWDLKNDYYDSFIAYQKLLLKKFDRMSGEYGFEVVDASRPVRRVASRLRRSISRLIADEPITGPSDATEVKTEEGARAASGAANVARESRADGLKKVKAA